MVMKLRRTVLNVFATFEPVPLSARFATLTVWHPQASLTVRYGYRCNEDYPTVGYSTQLLFCELPPSWKITQQYEPAK